MGRVAASKASFELFRVVERCSVAENHLGSGGMERARVATPKGPLVDQLNDCSRSRRVATGKVASLRRRAAGISESPLHYGFVVLFDDCVELLLFLVISTDHESIPLEFIYCLPVSGSLENAEVQIPLRQK